MPVSRSRARKIAAVAIAGAVASVTWLTTQSANAAADHLIINEVYGGGGNTNAPYTNDFVELYNPTSAPIDLAGYKLTYYSASGNSGGTCTLTGSIAPGSYYLAQQGGGATGQPLPTADVVCGLNMSGSNGSVELSSPAGVVDLVGYGTASKREGAAGATGLNNSTSASRTNFVDTDNNAADFTAGAPTPQNSATDASSPVSTPASPDPSQTSPAPTSSAPSSPPPAGGVSIADIQGTGATTPLAGQRVTTRGVVTAVYPTGGFNGYYIQTPGSGGAVRQPGQTSDGIFVYAGNAAGVNAVQVGKCYDVTGTAGEFNGLTQLATNPTVVEVADCAAPVPSPLASVPTDDAGKEPYEGMLVLPSGEFTITNNYDLNTFGQLGLVPGTEPLYQATDKVPYQQAPAYEAEQVKKLITLDDGSSWNYMTNNTAKSSALPYLSNQTPMRTGSQVTFTKPVILDYRFQWNFQPVTQVVGHEVDFLSSENDRPATVPAVGGDVQIATFNVLNYFTDLGQDEAGCRAYNDRNGKPVGANGCKVRGAYTPEAFADQQAKIVSAINGLDAEVVALMEIENSANFGHSRDHTLSKLVDALNAADPAKGWKFVPTNAAQVPPNEDNIRLAYIYREAEVKPVDGSLILSDPAFSNARQPVAQKFVIKGSTTEFVVIANHFKSKGSGEDDGTGQGNSNPSRKAQATALSSWANSTFADQAVFLVGDFNAYSQEEPMLILKDAGYTNAVADDEPTYQFGGRLGSLDHIVANAKAHALIAGGAVWNINGDESVAMQYSRRNYNVVDFFTPGPFASSDHDPAVVGLKKATTTPPTTPLPTHPASGAFGDHDGDQRADVYVVNAEGTLELWKGGPGAFPKIGDRGNHLATAVRMVQVGDLTGDRRSDVLVQEANGDLWLYAGNANGGLDKLRQVGRNWGAIDHITYVGKMDGSNRTFIVARTKDGNLYGYSISATSVSMVRQVGRNWSHVEQLASVGDLNGDGRSDLLAVLPDGTLKVYWATQTGTLAGGPNVGRGWQGAKAIFSPGDLNNDGRPDLVGVNSRGQMTAYHNLGNGALRAQPAAIGFSGDKLFA